MCCFLPKHHLPDAIAVSFNCCMTDQLPPAPHHAHASGNPPAQATHVKPSYKPPTCSAFSSRWRALSLSTYTSFVSGGCFERSACSTWHEAMEATRAADRQRCGTVSRASHALQQAVATKQPHQGHGRLPAEATVARRRCCITYAMPDVHTRACQSKLPVATILVQWQALVKKRALVVSKHPQMQRMPPLLLLPLLNDVLNQAWLQFAGPAPHLQLCCLVKPQVDNTPVCS